MILVVDDNADIRNLLTKFLHLDGFEVESVGSGIEAMLFLEIHTPHCIILDIDMPDMDGFQVLTQVRANADFSDVGIIMHSSFDRSMKTKSLAMGANAYVQKGSMNLADFRTLLEPFYDSASRNRELMHSLPRN
ncbi:MAG: chemotaxis protein CheA [Phycisphaerales bacterium]|nr:chemotaxis protein CheA [Phycisphaerales bacterium]